MKVTTAIITAGGYGTRMLPATAAIDKVLMPVLDRPVIDYVVTDCLAAGVTNIIFVTPPGSHGLQDYYIGNRNLEAYLNHVGKADELAKLSAIHAKATFSFIEQPTESERGTAVPIKLAAPHVPKDEAFIVCYGDAFLWNGGHHSELQRMAELFESTNAAGAVMGLIRPKSELPKYGVLAIESRGGHEFLTGLIEKPPPGEEPSDIINLGFYIFTPQILPYVEAVEPSQQPNHQLGEYLLTDGIEAAAIDHPLVVQHAESRFLDVGSVETWLEANLVVAAAQPELAAHLKYALNSPTA